MAAPAPLRLDGIGYALGVTSWTLFGRTPGIAGARTTGGAPAGCPVFIAAPTRQYRTRPPG